ncbi:MAG: glycosyl hydrolase family 8 [Sphingobacteriales bacterium]
MLFCSAGNAQSNNNPFSKHVNYAKGFVKPNNFAQSKLDQTVESFYTQWKMHYIKTIPYKKESYIWFEDKDDKQCVSEGQGYGMTIVSLMAEFDPSAKNTFDNLYRYYRAHPSNRGSHLMAGAQNTYDKDIDETSASDGDIDIAYSLLLANKQWGSKGTINYLQEAKSAIADIMRYDINRKTWSVLLSNGIENDSKDYFDTRSSDFMPANFKAFERATGDTRWQNVIDNGYKLFTYMQKEYSPDAGLVPDFIIHLNKKPKPAPAHYLESVYDGDYNYNACRVPWRVATDYLLSGDKRSKAFVQKINHWIRETTNNNTYNLSAGYTLAGNDIKGRYFEALSFITPFAVSAMVDKSNQQWLNSIWDYTVQFKLKDFDYYDNTIKMLNMIILSGNYWQP